MIIVSGENEGNANVLKTELLLFFFFFLINGIVAEVLEVMG